MKKINLVHWVYMMVVIVVSSLALQNCADNKQPETRLVVADTTKVIDTTIIEPGVAR